jgi:hypothetical protein
MGGGGAALLLLVMWVGVASAAVYEVGGTIGWTVMGNPDYAAWASSKQIVIGDTVGASHPSPCPSHSSVTRALFCASESDVGVC